MSKIFTHPDRDDLFDFFASKPCRLLTDGERKVISDHLTSCPECAAQERDIRQAETEWELTSSIPETEEEKAFVSRCIQGIREKPND